MPAGWYDDPFTDHLQRYWTGDSWTRETRPRPGVALEQPAAYAPVPTATVPDAAPVRDWLIPSILALIFCAWPLAIPGLIFAIKANGSRKRGDMAAAAQQAGRARLFVLLSVVLGIVVWVYLGFVIATAEMPTDQGTITPFGASSPSARTAT
jgi:hypothetical protein